MKRISNEEMDSITNKIDLEFERFIKEGKYKDVLVSMGNLGRYSLNNQFYIILQYPEARTINGLRKWNSLGRTVKKGEKAIKIFKPIIAKKEKEGASAEEKRILRGFQVGYVFDVKQTEGKDIDVFKFDESKIIESKKEIIDSLKKVAGTYGYKMIFVNDSELGEDCCGLCNHKTHEIKIRNDLADLQEVSTSIHELGHALAHSKKRDDFEGLTEKEKRGIKEVEAESIACIVCSYLGLDTMNFNFSYISGWAQGDINKFRKNLDLVSKYSGIIIDGIENGIRQPNMA